MDLEKVRAIQEWTNARRITEVRIFHGLDSFYETFLRNFSSIVACITYCTKGTTFKWTIEAGDNFKFLNKKETETPILGLPYFEKVFEVYCDASLVGIGFVLIQAGIPCTFLAKI